MNKTLRMFFLLLLVNFAVVLQHRSAVAQQGSIFIKPELGAVPYTWEFGITNHATTAVNQIVLWIDTTQYPNIAFGDAAIVGPLPGAPSPAYNQNWASGTNGAVSTNLDTATWCSETDYIGKDASDEWFDFELVQRNSSIPMTDTPIVIHWALNFASSNTCDKLSTVSTGTVEVIPEDWMSTFPLDTTTVVSSRLGDCDPSFNFTVQNRNQLRSPITNLVFKILPGTPASMRPTEVKAPAGWFVQDVTQNAAYFGTNNNSILPGASLSGFIVGLRAQASQTPYPFPFVWSAFNGGGIIERDTMLDTAASLRVAPCDNANSTPDTLAVENTGDCNFNFNLANVHSGEGVTAVSRITALKLQITSPGNVKWATATPPSLCWYYDTTNAGTQLVFHASDSGSCGQAGGTVQTYQASINDPNPGESVTVHWVDSSGPNAVSSGNVIISCAVGETPDIVSVDKQGDCCYRVIVNNMHTPTSNLHAVTLAMKAPINGAFDPNSFSSNANWAPNAGSGNTSVQFTASGGNGLQPGATDTFYFCTNPAQPGVAWPLEVITKIAQTNNIATDTTIKNVPGCTPPVVLDSVFHHINDTDCSDLIEVINRSSSPIDSIEVVPQPGSVAVESVSVAVPWTKIIQGDSAIIRGSQITGAALYFTVNYSGTITSPFAVRVRTIHVSAPASEIDTTLTCLGMGGVTPMSEQIPLDLSIAPNPLRNQTNITLTTGATSRVNMVLLNVLGQPAKVVEGSVIPAGEYHYSLDASTLPAGTYYLRLEANGQVMTKKLVIQR